MMFENSWAAVFRPGLETDYFDRHAQRPFEPSLTGFDSLSAWWLAELSRLIYRRESDEIGSRANGPTRGDILEKVGLRETAFFNQGGSQGALVEPVAAGETSFAVVTFRGSDDMEAWFDFNFDLVPVDWEPGGKVHQGFREALDAIWVPISNAIEALPDGTPVIYTGHSLGGAVATLAASRRPPAVTYTFGSPRAGDAAFGSTVPVDSLFRIVNNRDVITELPIGLGHVGQLHYITHNGQIRVNPDTGAIVLDRLKRDPSFELKRNLVDVITGPPQKLADHAPVNYVAHLERAVGGELLIGPTIQGDITSRDLGRGR